ncbi:hypothetical protein HSB1_33520 [Halogranum salarium B-1]|uniref:Uncharacterized protein n=1 Tax=Halogranum salarium B-1 TaxID=1210908 RepID=J2ZBA3_9EURY|nr:hypothetical protein HSB1_33520 [Halogranum salarium B-1]
MLTTAEGGVEAGNWPPRRRDIEMGDARLKRFAYGYFDCSA